MTFLWLFHDFFMTFSRLFHDLSMTFSIPSLLGGLYHLSTPVEILQQNVENSMESIHEYHDRPRQKPIPAQF